MVFEKFRETVKKYGMLSGGEVIVVAVSGGIDSVVLLHLMCRHVKEYGGDLVAAHLHHGLRGNEADRDEAFVRDLAGNLDISFRSRRVALLEKAGRDGLNIQDAGRRERYAFFEEILKEVGGSRVTVGHNADDQAETVLMRMIRGTGIKGLGGIPPVRGSIIRPLIEITREEISAYASGEGIGYLEDSSNLSTKYLRNSVRHELVPKFKEYNPQFCKELNLLSSIARDMDAYLDGEALSVFGCVRKKEGKVNGQLSLDTAKLNDLPSALRAKVIFKALEEVSGDPSGFFSTHIMDVAALSAEGRRGASISLPKGIKVVLGYGDILFIPGGLKGLAPFSSPLNMDGKTEVPEIKAAFFVESLESFDAGEREEENSVFLDVGRLRKPLEVRNFRKGDRIKPLGMEGSKKLKAFFIDRKVPRHLRQNVPLLVSGGEILWVVGLRKCGSAHADGKSSNVIKIASI